MFNYTIGGIINFLCPKERPNTSYLTGAILSYSQNVPHNCGIHLSTSAVNSDVRVKSFAPSRDFTLHEKKDLKFS
ncbi:MAG: hypothetical protein A2X86_15530 [Bdellovibrionales bacterium GWA2_49_15]|nr:MAG: hypothetical protein A2X86_15530 [Bdellovibrionales bacterium GWA2_49_15]HAZ14541.1 hypothetical protein [Bdellovibrionales bacterium]